MLQWLGSNTLPPQLNRAKCMYEWRTLRAWASFLLCLPLVHFTYIVANDMSAVLDPSPSVWDDEMAVIIESDMKTVLPDNPVVVVGGQEVRLKSGNPEPLVSDAFSDEILTIGATDFALGGNCSVDLRLWSCNFSRRFSV